MSIATNLVIDLSDLHHRRSNLPHLESQLAALEARIKAAEERLARAQSDKEGDKRQAGQAA